MKKVAWAVALALACALGVWWLKAGPDRHDDPASGRADPVAPSSEALLAADRPVLEVVPSRTNRAPGTSGPTATAWAIRGRVVDDQGVPVAGAEVTLRPAHVNVSEEGVAGATDDLGRFTFARVVADTYTVRLEGSGREPVTIAVRVLDADVTGLELVVATGRSLEVLVEAEELPTSGLRVSVSGADGVNRFGVPDARGRAVFVVPEGRTLTALDRIPTGWLPGPGPRSRETRVGAEPASVRLSLVRADVITGFVRRPDGRPLSGAVLWFRPGNDAVAGSDETGAFRLPVRSGTVGELVCEEVVPRPGAPPSRVAYYGIAREVRAGATGVVVEVDEVARDRALRFLVRDPDGMPAGGVMVHASIAGAEYPRSANTDPSGSATFTKLPARPVRVDVVIVRQESAWLPPPAVEVLPEGQEVVFDLRRGARLTGRITGPSGPIPSTSIEAWNKSAAVAFGLSDDEGNFAFTIDPAEHFPLLICARLGKRYSEAFLQFDRLPATPLELQVSER